MRKLRDSVLDTVSLEYFQQRTAAGWKLKAIEWEQEEEEPANEITAEPAPPYGLAVKPETARLEVKPEEVEVLRTILELIVVEKGIAHIAQELNSRGFCMRNGQPWTSVGVFNLLPRIVEAGADILKSDEWKARGPQPARDTIQPS